MFFYIKYYLEKMRLNSEWRKRNPHNETTVVGKFNFECVDIGNYTYGAIQVLNYSSNERLKIGHFCSIAGGVLFILSADHRIDTLSTFPFKVKCLQCVEQEGVSKGDIIVGNDVWIGQNAIILSGVHIGQGAVIGAGTVVTKDIPPYAVVVGNPARVIKYRFSDELIRELLKIDYGKLTKEMISEHISDLYDKLETSEQLEWIPKK